jgi:hypothetical protein
VYAARKAACFSAINQDPAQDDSIPRARSAIGCKVFVDRILPYAALLQLPHPGGQLICSWDDRENQAWPQCSPPQGHA